MKVLNHDGRLTLLLMTGKGADIHNASGASLPWDPAEALERWPEIVAWAKTYRGSGDVEIDARLIGPPSPRPRQIIAIGLNYAAHAAEAGEGLPEFPMIFSKLHASLAGPAGDVILTSGTVDWEAEVAVIIGRTAQRVSRDSAWDYIAGLTTAQDISDREIQLRPADTPQYVLGKSLPGFCPTGPLLVTPDELPDRDDIELACFLNGEEMQHARTSDLIFPIAELVEYLSHATILYPGDLILTGTPSGIGATRTPPRFLAAGDVLETRITGIGEMRHLFTADPHLTQTSAVLSRA